MAGVLASYYSHGAQEGTTQSRKGMRLLSLVWPSFPKKNIKNIFQVHSSSTKFFLIYLQNVLSVTHSYDEEKSQLQEAEQTVKMQKQC